MHDLNLKLLFLKNAIKKKKQRTPINLTSYLREKNVWLLTRNFGKKAYRLREWKLSRINTKLYLHAKEGCFFYNRTFFETNHHLLDFYVWSKKLNINWCSFLKAENISLTSTKVQWTLLGVVCLVLVTYSDFGNFKILQNNRTTGNIAYFYLQLLKETYNIFVHWKIKWPLNNLVAM